MHEMQIGELKKLGIHLWLPREPIKGAASSPEWVYGLGQPTADRLLDDEQPKQPIGQQPLAHAAEVAKKHPESHAEHRAIAHIQEALEPKTEEIREEAKPALEISREARSPAVTPRFRMAMVLSEKTLVIDQLPVQAALGFSQQHSRLLSGIMRSLGEDPRSLSMPTLLHWPLLAGKTLNQGPEEAYKNVQRQVEWMLKDRKVERILLFGEDLVRWVVGLETEKTELSVVHPRWNLPYLSTLSLSQALQLPDMKRQIWLDIQPFV